MVHHTLSIAKWPKPSRCSFILDLLRYMFFFFGKHVRPNLKSKCSVIYLLNVFFVKKLVKAYDYGFSLPYCIKIEKKGTVSYCFVTLCMLSENTT